MTLAAQFRERLRGRRSISMLLVLGGFWIIGSRLWGAAPREISLVYELGPEHRALTEARVGYRRDGEEVQSARFTYPEGAPPAVRHQVSLPPGNYEIVADLIRGREGRSFVRPLEVPAEGVVHVRFFEAAPRTNGAVP